MDNWYTAWLAAHPILGAAVGGMFGVMLADLILFKNSKEPGQFWLQFDFKLAGWRYLQGFTGGFVGNSIVAGLASGAAAAVGFLLYRFLPVLLVVGLVVSSTACGKARHIAVTVDATIAQAVFAVDDAEWNAWKAGAISDERHAAISPTIKAALESVKTATAAVRAMKADGQVPGSLVALIAEMRQVQAIAVGLPPSDLTRALGGKVDTALDKAIGLLSEIVGTEGQ